MQDYVEVFVHSHESSRPLPIEALDAHLVVEVAGELAPRGDGLSHLGVVVLSLILYFEIQILILL